MNEHKKEKLIDLLIAVTAAIIGAIISKLLE
jgi:hypothetical protein